MFLFLFVNWTIDHYFGALHLHLTYTCILFSAPLPSLVSSTHAWKSSESWSPCSLWETSRAFTLRCWNLPGSYTKLDSPDLLHHNAVCVCVIKRWLHFRQGLHTHVHLMSGWDNPLWLWPSHAILTLKKHLLPPSKHTHMHAPYLFSQSQYTQLSTLVPDKGYCCQMTSVKNLHVHKSFNYGSWGCWKYQEVLKEDRTGRYCNKCNKTITCLLAPRE